VSRLKKYIITLVILWLGFSLVLAANRPIIIRPAFAAPPQPGRILAEQIKDVRQHLNQTLKELSKNDTIKASFELTFANSKLGLLQNIANHTLLNVTNALPFENVTVLPPTLTLNRNFTPGPPSSINTTVNK
jgi:hypothetical protein